ncbi:MAG TPA: crossover junction endodeoxyribonuclease RuvC [Candidatus Wunengus sp. YC61]|uniref:crossover junction endodeoxyribonuclease RuvC n=1 Tax=Candidatus Wunengus sp. YC61 TaxID=3367698 RepID=UPI0040287A11
MKLLAIDTGTKTGFCMMRDGFIYESGTMDFSKKRGESNGMMFFRFRNWLSTILDAWCGVDMVVYEQAHHRGGAATEIGVNLTGRIQECCAERGIEFASIHSGTLKKAITGHGNADKQEMIAFARLRLGREPLDDNEADAVALAAFGWGEYGRINNHTSTSGAWVNRLIREDI